MLTVLQGHKQDNDNSLTIVYIGVTMELNVDKTIKTNIKDGAAVPSVKHVKHHVDYFRY